MVLGDAVICSISCARVTFVTDPFDCVQDSSMFKLMHGDVFPELDMILSRVGSYL